MGKILGKIKGKQVTTCITNRLFCVYSENPTEFPLVRFLFTNLVLANATSHNTNTL
jgi:hypothetical protein